MANDLEEKFVADDGVSTVPDAVTPAGGEHKKKKADLNKKVDPKADTVASREVPGQSVTEASKFGEGPSPHDKVFASIDHMDPSRDQKAKEHNISFHVTDKNRKSHSGQEVTASGTRKNMQKYLAHHYGDHEDAKEFHPHVYKEDFDISIEESIASIFEGMDLSEDFKGKVTMVFEAAVNEAATVKANAIAEELEEEFEKQLEEAIDESMDEIVENLDSYLDYVVNEWLQENEVAIETGIKVEMAESLMEGLKELFTEHNIEVDEDTIDVVAGLEEEIAELKGEFNKTIDENIELSKAVLSLEAEKVFEEMTEGLTVSQRERLRTLSENLDVTDLDSYTSNLETLKESFFKKSKPSLNESTYEDEDEIITEEETKKTPSQYATVNALVEALDARSSKK